MIFFRGFRAKFQKIVTCVAFSIKFAKTNKKFAENSEFCEKIHYLIVNYSLHSLGPAGRRRRRLREGDAAAQQDSAPSAGSATGTSRWHHLRLRKTFVRRCWTPINELFSATFKDE